jgi:hypothetical protein
MMTNFDGGSHLNFGDGTNYITLAKKSTDAHFIAYVVFRDDTSVMQHFSHYYNNIIEDGILTLVGKTKDERMLRVHFPLDHVKHWCDAGPGEKREK